jgi:hypothetical protein
MNNQMLYNEFNVQNLSDVNSMKKVHLLQLSQLSKMFKCMDDTKEFLLENLDNKE